MIKRGTNKPFLKSWCINFKIIIFLTFFYKNRCMGNQVNLTTIQKLFFNLFCVHNACYKWIKLIEPPEIETENCFKRHKEKESIRDIIKPSIAFLGKCHSDRLYRSTTVFGGQVQFPIIAHKWLFLAGGAC